MNQVQRLNELKELYLKKQRGRFNVEKIAFEQQLKFINDEARLKALFCTRRAAKSYTGGLYLIREALANHGCNVLYIGLTRQSAHGIIWKDILRELDTKFSLNIKFNETLLTATLPNGSVIWVTGADTDESEMNKLLGRKYRLVILDEASMFSVNMHQLVYGVLKPATADQRGTICLLGTSSNITRGLFYDITTQKEAGWSLHKWSANDNPHVKVQWAEELEDIRVNRPEFMKTALFRQWYLNQWVVDEEAKVYKYDDEINRVDTLPRGLGDFHYVLGLDLAHSPDSTAFVVSAYHKSDPKLYLIYARKHLKMDITAASHEVQRLHAKYDFDVKVVDGANKMAVEEMNNRHLCGLIPADKTGKVDFIRLMNDEFVQGKIMLLPGAYEKHEQNVDSLADEYSTLVWVTDNGKVVEPRKEHPGIHNDMADAALYNWRYCYQYLFKTPVKGPEWTSQERWEGDHVKKLIEQVKKEQNPNQLDLSFDKDLFDFSLDDQL